VSSLEVVCEIEVEDNELPQVLTNGFNGEFAWYESSYTLVTGEHHPDDWGKIIHLPRYQLSSTSHDLTSLILF
jgi:hypothetical protein